MSPLPAVALESLDALGELNVSEDGGSAVLVTGDSDTAIALLTRLRETKNIAVVGGGLSDVFFTVTGKNFDHTHAAD